MRHDWASTGATAIAADADVAVVVDVLSFTTTLSVATDLGVPSCPTGGMTTAPRGVPPQHDAVLAVRPSRRSPWTHQPVP